jgi:hypothetical protein
MTNDDTAADDAPFVQAYKLPPTLEPQIVAGMARAYELRVVKQTGAAIIVEGCEDDLVAFADRLEQLSRLCR